APAELPVLKRMGNMGMADVAGVVQPVWFVVQVPRDAKVGTYSGKVTIHVDGAGPARTAIQLRIAGEWAAPNPQDSTLHVGMLESPDSLAMQYNVPLWSDEHWKLLDRTFELMGQLGNREVYIPVITKTQLGNEHSMVRWIKRDDGSYKHDFSIAEKYLDTAIRRLGPIHMVCFYVTDLGFGGRGRVDMSAPFEVTEYDPASKKLKPLPTPKWGTGESRRFWKPVVAGFQAMLAKRGLRDKMMMGMASNSFAPLEAVSDLKVLAPQARWADCSHLWGSRRVGRRKDSQAIGRMATAGGAPLGVMWDPDVDKPHYNWRPNPKDDRILVAGPRGKCTPNLHQALAHYRLTCETTLLSSYGWFNGFGQIGADFFPVLKAPEGVRKDRPGRSLDNRYVYWGSLNLSSMVNVMLGAGKKHPVHTARSQMFRESLVESEARVFVTDALLDDAPRAKLGPALAAECKRVCDDRTRTLRHCSYFFAPGEHHLDYGRMFNQEQWELQTEQLVLAAEKVAKALGKN
ncbi:MAG TPA: glycoside hydrolase domain-containing protein, partial [Phycisphaerae bacterium]|nr:glycoside hydrolase domain-containing protein [Phycisphaerae bacterium]